MGKRNDVPTRGEVSESVKKHQADMVRKEEDLGVLATDTETVRSTLDSLDFGGTSEGVDAVQGAIEEAENVTVEIFEREDEVLEDIQRDSEDYQNDLQGRAETAEMDLGRISDASGRVETQETVSRLADAKNAVMEDRDFLRDEVERSDEARNESDRMQKELQDRVLARRR